jgi:hypothetical protein
VRKVIHLECGTGPLTFPIAPSYSVVREVGIRLRDTSAVRSCVELNALRCSRGMVNNVQRDALIRSGSG